MDTFVELRAVITDFQAKMAVARGEMAKTAKAGDTSFSSMGKGAAIAGAAVAAGAIAVGVASVKMAADFQQNMSKLVTSGGELQKNLGADMKGVEKLMGQTGTSASQLAAGLYVINSAGFHGAAGLQVLKAAAEGAKTENADLGTVTDGVTTLMNDYHQSASQAALVTSKMVTATSLGKTSFQDLAGSLHTVSPAADAAGVSMNEVLGAMATMTAKGTPAADAATYLRQTILQLSNPSQKAAAEMQALGLSAIDISQHLGQRGLTGTLSILTDAIQSKMGPAGTVLIDKLKGSAGSASSFDAILANLPKDQQTFVGALADMVGGTKSMQAALELTGPSMTTFKADVAKIASTTTEAGGHVAGWSVVQKTLNQQIAEAKGTIQALAIQLGTALIPMVSKLLGFITSTVTWFDKHRAAAILLATAIGGPLVAALVLYIKRTVTAIALQVAENFTVIAGAAVNAAKAITAVAAAQGAATAANGGALLGFARIGGVFAIAAASVTALAIVYDKLKTSEDKAKAADQSAADSFVQGFLAQTNAMGGTKAQQDKLIESQMKAIATQEYLTGATFKQGDEVKLLKQYLDDEAAAQDGANAAVNDSVGKLIANSNASKTLASDTAALSVAQKGMGDITTATTNAIQASQDAVLGMMQSEDSWQSNLQSLGSTLDQNTAITDQQGKTIGRTGVSMDITTAKGLANKTALDNLSAATYQHVQSLVKQGATTQTIDGYLATHQADLEATAGKYGFTKTQVDKYLGSIGLTPGSINTTLKTSGYSDTLQQIHTLAYAIQAIKDNKVIVQFDGQVLIPGVDFPAQGLPLTRVSGTLATGGVTRGPALVGEGNPAYPEYVIPTDPAHRANAVQLLTSAARIVGAGMAAGGVVGASPYTPAGSYTGLTRIGPPGQGGAGTLSAAIDTVFSTSGDWAIMPAIGAIVAKMLSQLRARAQVLAPTAGPSGSFANIQAIGRSMAAGYGWTGAEWVAFNNVVMRESGWNPSAQNPTSTAFGIAQNIGGPAGYGAYGTSPAGQIAWMLAYIKGRYGDPIGAWAHELSAGWYDQGGLLPPGLSLAYNTTGRAEVVAPGGAAGGVCVNVYGNVYGAGGIQELSRQIRVAIERDRRAGTPGLVK